MTSTPKPRKTIPILPVETEIEVVRDPLFVACASGEPFALMVLGDSMEPEFAEGEIILIEPEGMAAHGSYVLAELAGELIFRQLVKDGKGAWHLKPLNPAYRAAEIRDVRETVKGVIIQKSKPGRRKATKRYVD